jgi:putative glutathione S-transferase
MSRDVSHLTDITRAKNEEDGVFLRPPTSFRNAIQHGGKYPPEKDRFYLFVSYACPWASRTLIVRKLKGLEQIVPFSVVSPRMGANGWAFHAADPYPDANIEPLYQSSYLKDLYLRADPGYSGRFTVPILWDKKRRTIVNNESAEIIRMFNSDFNKSLPEDKAGVDLYPEPLREEIDGVNEWVYEQINNGVYKAGFATSQEAYQEAVTGVFEGLDRAEAILKEKPYLCGDELTEADIRLYVTAVRFDPVYVGHFKCNVKTIRHDYPNIHLWMRKLYWKNDAFQSATNFDHIKTHYYWSHPHINPTRVVPAGPVPDILPLEN